MSGMGGGAALIAEWSRSFTNIVFTDSLGYDKADDVW